MPRFIFEDPPEPDINRRYDNRQNSDREQIIAALRDREVDRWVVVSFHRSRARSSQTARDLRVRHPDGYEFQAGSSPKWGEVVYGRYVPGKVKLE